jgi:hypothetical protein
VLLRGSDRNLTGGVIVLAGFVVLWLVLSLLLRTSPRDDPRDHRDFPRIGNCRPMATKPHDRIRQPTSHSVAAATACVVTLNQLGDRLEN